MRRTTKRHDNWQHSSLHMSHCRGLLLRMENCCVQIRNHPQFLQSERGLCYSIAFLSKYVRGNNWGWLYIWSLVGSNARSYRLIYVHVAIAKSKGLITWRIAARVKILTRSTRLKFCRDYNTTSARAGILASAPNMKLHAKSPRRIKMAPRTRIVKIDALLLSQFGLVAALNFQLFRMVTAYKMMELKRNLSLAAFLSAGKMYLQRKEKISSSSPSSRLSWQRRTV